MHAGSYWGNVFNFYTSISEKPLNHLLTTIDESLTIF